MKGKGTKSLVILGCAIVFFTLPACTTMKNVGGFLRIWDRSNATADKSYKSFASTVKPVLRGNAESHYTLARFYQDRGRHQAAIAEFQKAVAIDPQSVKAYNAMGVSYDSIALYRQATLCYEAAVKLDPTAGYVYNNMGYSFMLQGNHGEAVEAFKKALSLDSENIRIHNNLARAYSLSGQVDLATNEFEYSVSRTYAETLVEQITKGAAGPVTTSNLSSHTRPDTSGAIMDDPFVTRVSEFLASRDSDNPSSPPDKAATVEARSAEQKSTGATRVEVSNGNGVNQMATMVGDYLRKKGFRVARITNARSFNIARTCVYYQKDHSAVADEIARQMKGNESAHLVSVNHLDVPQINVKLVIGKDIAQYQKAYLMSGI
jgi:hypothetical protein